MAIFNSYVKLPEGRLIYEYFASANYNRNHHTSSRLRILQWEKNCTQVSKQAENMAEALVYSTTNSTNLWHHGWLLFENKTRQPTITTTSIVRKHYPKPLPCSLNYHADTVHPQIFPNFFPWIFPWRESLKSLHRITVPYPADQSIRLFP